MRDINGRYTGNILDADKKAPSRTRIAEQLVKRQLVRSADDVAKWTQALRIAESAENPDRTELIRIFNNVEIDGHISGITNAIKNKIKRKEFMVVNPDGSEDEDATRILEKEWFFRYLDWNIEAPFFGFSLIELGDMIDDGFPKIQLVPRVNVVPDVKKVKFDTMRFSQGMKAIDYTKPPYSDWTVFIGTQKGLGLYNIIAPTAIAKKHVMAAMWEYTEIFGMPIRQGMTDIHDPDRRLNMERMLDNMGSAAWGVFDRDDEIQLVESVDSDASVFLDPIKLANDEISKTLMGSTGMMDEKSFVGSAEVQERLFSELIVSYQRQIMFDMNNKLMPIMTRLGIFKEGQRFKWKQEESLTTQEKADYLLRLLPFMTVRPDDVERVTGIPVEAVRVSQEAKDLNVAARVKELYKNFDIKK